MDDDAPQLWTIADLEPNKQPKDLAEELANHFTSITNEARKLVESDIPRSIVPSVLIPQLLESNVAKRLREYKKPNSTVPGDIPKSLISPVIEELAKPLTRIYNTCLAHTKWPKLWKREEVMWRPQSDSNPENTNTTEL